MAEMDTCQRATWIASDESGGPRGRRGVSAMAAEPWRGRRVVAHLGMTSGGDAQLAVAGAGSLHAIPDSLDADAAVAMIGTGRTTMAILDLAPPSEDDVMLVTAAAGGIGTLLVQHGRHEGATVSSAPHALRRSALSKSEHSRPRHPVASCRSSGSGSR